VGVWSELIHDSRNTVGNLGENEAQRRARLRLWCRIVSRFPVCQRHVWLGSQTFLITYVGDEEWGLRALENAPASHDRQDPRWQPYWVRAWESSLALAALIEQLPINHRQVLDLGCGVGVVGAKAASLQAYVTLVDAVPAALLFATWNCWPWRSRVQIRRLDWQCESLPQTFDWIFGADILYSQDDWPYLDRFWHAHLKAGGHVLLAEPLRSSANTFPEWASRQGWQVSQPYPNREIGDRCIRFFQLFDPAKNVGI
jgi:SAM-dependent methyltransferase